MGLVSGYWYEMLVLRQDAEWCSAVVGSIQMYTKKQECSVIKIFYYVQEYGHFESSQSIGSRN